jgi:hypothetical protein
MVLDGNMVYYPLARRLPSCVYHYYLPWLDQTPLIRAQVERCLQNDQTRFLIIPDRNQPMLQQLWPLINQQYAPLAADSSIWQRIEK